MFFTRDLQDLGCKLDIWMEASGVSLPCIHFMPMPSINLSHENGFRLAGCSSCISSLPIDILAYDRAILLPMAVP